MTAAPRRRAVAALAALAWLGLAQTARAIRPSGVFPQDGKKFALNRATRRPRRAPGFRALQAFQGFNERQGGAWKARYDPRTGALSALSEGKTVPRPGGPEVAAASFLNDAADFSGIDPTALSIQRRLSGDGISHFLYQQTYRGLPVEFARVKVHVGRDGTVLGLNSSFEPDLALEIVPGLGAHQAFQAVSRELGVPAAPGSLVIFPDENSGQARLAWKYSVRKKWSLWSYYVDAHTGQILFRYDRLRRVCAGAEGTVTAMIYAVDPTSTPARVLPLANQRVYVRDGDFSHSAVTDPAGHFCAPKAGKVIASLQGPNVNVSNFVGPSAHFDNGAGSWTIVGLPAPIATPHPYSDGADLSYSANLSGVAPDAGPGGAVQIVKALPVFNNFNVGAWSIDADGVGDISDDDEVTVIDSSGNVIGSYLGNRGTINGAAAHGKSWSVRLRSNAEGRRYGFDVAVSSVLVLTNQPTVTAASSDIHWTSTRTHNGMNGEINLFYHLNAMHDYFISDVDKSSVAAISKPVNAVAFIGPSNPGAFYNPEYDSLNFGDITASPLSDAATDDATVSRHEYTHFMLEKIWPIQNFGQAGAISEGNADYFSASSLDYSSIGKHFNSAAFGNSTPLRELDCPTKTACQVFSAAAWQGEIHADSIFFSQALWDIRKAQVARLGQTLGRSCADGLVFQSLLFFPESFAEFHDALKRVDRLALVPNCGGPSLAAAAINSAFAAHGLPHSNGDALEANDGFQTAVDVSTYGAISATIYPGTDLDFYSFAAGPGAINVTLTLPKDGLFYKAYALTLYDRDHNPLAKAEPPYDGLHTIDHQACESSDCTTTRETVTLSYNALTPNYYYLRVSGGPTGGNLLTDGSMSAVNSTLPYSLSVQYSPAAALAAAIVQATFDNDTIDFSVNVTTFVSVQNFTFAYARLRNQSLDPLPGTTAGPGLASAYLAFVSSRGALGNIRGSLRLQPGFAAAYPSVGTVYIEVFGFNPFNVLGSTASLGLSQGINLTANRTELTAWNNVLNPETGQKATIKYETAAPGRVSVRLYTLSGALVQVLYDGYATSGKGSLDWQGKNMNGATVASGIYLLHIQGPGISKTKKIVIVK